MIRADVLPVHNLGMTQCCANAKGRHTNNDFPLPVCRVWIVCLSIVLFDNVGGFGAWSRVRIGCSDIRCEVEQKGKRAGQGSCAEQVLQGLKQQQRKRPCFP